MSDNLIFPDTPGGLPSKKPQADLAPLDGVPAPPPPSAAGPFAFDDGLPAEGPADAAAFGEDAFDAAPLEAPTFEPPPFDDPAVLDAAAQAAGPQEPDHAPPTFADPGFADSDFADLSFGDAGHTFMDSGVVDPNLSNGAPAEVYPVDGFATGGLEEAAFAGDGFGDDGYSMDAGFVTPDGFAAEPEPVTVADAPPPDDAFDVSFADAEPIIEPPDADDTGGKSAAGKRDRSRTKDGLLLGVHVTPKHVYGVLVRPAGDGYEPLRQFVRNRSEDQFGGAVDAFSPDEIGLGDTDLTLGAEDEEVQFGGAGEIDFSAEFAGLGVATDAAFDSTATMGPLDAQAQPIVFELRDILDECEQAGFGRPALAFAVDAPDVEYVEITVPPEKKGKKAKKEKKGKKAADAPEPSVEGAVKRERLLTLLAEQLPTVDKARAVFVPMTARDGMRRYMAIVPTSSEPVVESVEMLREQGAYRKTQFRTLEAEVPLLTGLVRMTLDPDVGENTAVVRVGAEDTIVLLLSGGDIHHYEKMQSVTAFDGPDTICSRVLLQQDVQGVGTVHNVVVVAEEREKELVQGFAAFYPDARVETLREGMATLGLVGPYGPLAPSLVEAAGAALAGHLVKAKDSPFEDANLLPADLRKRKRKLEFSFSWHTLFVAVLLFLSVLFFSYLFVSQEGEIAEAEQRLAEFPPEAQMSVPQLQARIDSLQRRKADLAASLVTLDSLLLDTDRWTQTLLRATRAAAGTGGIWIEEWAPSGNDITLQGYATTRDNVVRLADRLGATIESVTFQALRDYPVYEYQMRFTQPSELPQVTRVLRERAGEPPPAEVDPLAGLDAPPPPPDVPSAN